VHSFINQHIIANIGWLLKKRYANEAAAKHTPLRRAVQSRSQTNIIHYSFISAAESARVPRSLNRPQWYDVVCVV
jgi:hypothetical protein